MAIGYIYFEKMVKIEEDKLYQELLKRKEVVPVPYDHQLDFLELKRMLDGCDVVMNYAAGEPITLEAIELSKSIEELGIKVVNSSHSYYYQEDKWMFYLKCLEHRLPTPKCYFVPKEVHNEKKWREVLTNSPLVLKAIFSDNGMCVERARDYAEFKRKLKKIISKNPVSPVIAQEFIPNDGRSYRATVIGYKVEQFIEKQGKEWKQTGHYKSEKFKMLKPSPSVKKLCERAARAFGMEVCGLDLMRDNDKYYLIEVNSCPGLDFFYEDEQRVSKKIADYLTKL